RPPGLFPYTTLFRSDAIGVWPTWPTLGVDARNQFDLFRDLPGGLAGVRKLADNCRDKGAAFFVCYNPWDESTRSEGHLSGLARLDRKSTRLNSSHVK